MQMGVGELGGAKTVKLDLALFSRLFQAENNIKQDLGAQPRSLRQDISSERPMR